MAYSRNNLGVAHQNVCVERHGHLKSRIKQVLPLRSKSVFGSLAA